MKKNVSGQNVGAQLVSASDGSAFTGSVTVAVTVDAGTQATGSVGSGACTHEGGGYHTYAPAQAETNGDLIAFTFSGTGAVPVTVQVYTRPTTGLLAPTVADRTLDVSSGGEAGIDWANVGSPTTTLNLSGTTVSTSQAVASVSGAVGSVTGNVGGNVVGSVASVATGGITSASFAAGAITASAIAADAIGASELAADAVAEIQSGLSTLTSANVADAVWNAATASYGTAGSYGLLVETNLDATVSSRGTSTLTQTQVTGGAYSLASASATLGDTRLANLDAAVSSRGTSTVTTAQVNAEVDTALADVGLTTTVTGRIDAAVSTRLASASYTAPLDAAGVRSAVGLASANLDTQLDAIPTNTDLTAALAAGVVVTTNNDKTGYSLATAPPTAAAIADAVWDEATSGHQTAGTTGLALTSASAPTAAAVADAVWDEALSGHATAGTAGAYLAAAGGASDPLLNAVPGSYASGTAGHALGRIGTATVEVTSPVAADGETVTLKRGCDYSAGDGLAVEWTGSGGGWGVSFASATAAVIINGTAYDATITSASAPKTVRWAPDADTTAALRAGVSRYTLLLTQADGEKIPLVDGEVHASVDVMP